MSTSLSYYAILGVSPEADDAAIAAAFRERTERLEADGEGDEELALVRMAYDTLKNPVLRRRYDERRASLAAEAMRAEAAGEPVQRPPTSLRRQLLLVALLAVVAYGYWNWSARRGEAPESLPAARPPASGSSAPTPAAQPDERPVLELAPLPPPSAPPAGAPPAPAAALSSAPSSSPTPAPARPPRPPGFDANYLVWSAFFIDRPGEGSGSGVMVAPDRIVTNCHVLAGAGLSGILVVHSVTHRATRVTEYARLDNDDACLLHAPGAGNYAVDWGDPATLASGAPTHTFGHPNRSSDPLWATGQFLRRMEIRGRGDDVLLTTNYCRPGSSGSPLFDGEGRLVGIVAAVERFTTADRETFYGRCLSIASTTARQLLSRPLFPVAMAPAAQKNHF